MTIAHGKVHVSALMEFERSAEVRAMNCRTCNALNDPDARFCSECGKPLAEKPHGEPAKARKGYFFILLMLPVIAAAAGIGYYKFFLPEGIAAVVNGEEIKRSELDSAVARATGSGEAASGMLRRQVLNRLVAERIMLQEARKADISVSKEEIAAASAEARVSSGLDEESFRKQMASQYGGVKAFENALERRLLVNRFVTRKVVPQGADPPAADGAVKQWFDSVSDRATVRIALTEQGAGPGCGCCGKQGRATARPGQGMPGCKVAAAAPAQPASDQKGAAIEAALQYWRAKHGPETVTARAIDYGCHVQVDIVKNEKIIGSLRYQGGSILEQ